MKLLILDTRRGGHNADLLILEDGNPEMKKMQFGYVPELHYDATNHQIVVVETELKNNNSDRTQHWLKCFSANNLELLLQKQTPARPMYAGYPGRSTRVKSSPSGRFLYFLESTMHPDAFDIYRILVHRYDYQKDEIQAGQIKIDSCMIDFDQFGADEDELCFHLSCEFPSVIAFGNFNSPELELLQLEKLPPRTHGPKETCGSWFSKNKNELYCINGEGTIYKVNSPSNISKSLVTLPLKEGNFIPLQQICETDGSLLIGVSTDIGERGLSLASQIWRVAVDDGEILDKIQLPFPIMNFIVTPDDYYMVGVSPYQCAIVFVEMSSGKILGMRDNIGVSPAEVLAIP